MRKIKFRAWDKNSKKMRFGFWIGSLGSGPRGVKNLQPTILKGKDEDWILLESTGLKDCKGIEIYEGDIVKFKNEKEEVETETITWHKELTGFYPLIDFPFSEEMEVIGNIYENKELLNQPLTKHIK